MNLDQLKLRFGRLAPRERLLVSIGAVFVAAALVYALLLEPLSSAHDAAEQRVGKNRALLSDLEQVASRHGPISGGAAPGAQAGDQSLVVLVDRSTREKDMGTYLKRNQPDGTNGVRLRLENVPFDLLVEWLAETEARYGLTATSASFDPSGEPGRVHSNLVLTQA